jgi:flagellar protein FlgJ
MTAAISGFSQFAQLRNGAEQHDPAALREVASQFEALFVEMIFKDMRAAKLADSPFGGGEQQEMYMEMLDQQFAESIASGRGIGFADMLVQQLGGGVQPVAATSERFLQPAIASNVPARSPHWSSPDEFVRDLWPYAERLAKRLSVEPEAILAQAALETGWGEHVLLRKNGASSNNLFGIKASGDWSGGSVARQTIEYVDGVAERRLEQFRAYPDLASTFEDYAALIENDPRYSAVPGAHGDIHGFATALQQAGYATDPLYAAKIERIHASETMRDAIGKLKIQ